MLFAEVFTCPRPSRSTVYPDRGESRGCGTLLVYTQIWKTIVIQSHLLPHTTRTEADCTHIVRLTLRQTTRSSPRQRWQFSLTFRVLIWIELHSLMNSTNRPLIVETGLLHFFRSLWLWKGKTGKDWDHENWVIRHFWAWRILVIKSQSVTSKPFSHGLVLLESDYFDYIVSSSFLSLLYLDRVFVRHVPSDKTKRPSFISRSPDALNMFLRHFTVITAILVLVYTLLKKSGYYIKPTIITKLHVNTH